MSNHHYDFRIIVIDDNPAIHYDFIKILSNPPSPKELDELDKKIFGKDNAEAVLPKFHIDTANQGQEGLDKIAACLTKGEHYALAFVDLRMSPSMNGIETIKNIWKIDPDIQVVICTAYTDYTWEETVAELGQTDNLIILKKPFDNVTVRQVTCALTRKWQLTQETKHHVKNLEHRIRESTQSLEHSVSLARATMDSSADGILVSDNHGKIIEYNSKFLSMWGLRREGLLRSDAFTVLNRMSKDSQDPNKFIKKIKEITEHGDSINIDVVRLRNGKAFEFYSQPQKLSDKNVGRVWSFRDITQRVSLEEKLQHSATHDTLTGLPNRVLLNSYLQQAASTAQLNNMLFAVLYLDLDHFKLVNDNLGTAIGDQFITTIAERLRASIRPCDTLVRMSSDEFVILLTEIASKDYIVEIAAKILDVISEPIKINDREIITTASMGVSVYPKDSKNTDILLAYADTAITYAKKAGGNQVKFHSKKMNEDSAKIFEQETELRRAIINDEFTLCYQPELEMSTGKLIAVEALIRWNHPTKGLLYPADFLPLAQLTGLIIPIGDWILRTACKQAKAWQEAGYPPIRVAVNITSDQLGQYDFIKTVVNILEQTKLDPTYLELELTEDMVFSNPDIIKITNALKEIGIHIALDDFGTGYSSLNNLRKMSIDRLKIDSSFVQNIQRNTQDEAIIYSIIDIANHLNLEVLAEGVESKEQLDFLQSKKIGQIQGFYFSHALTAEELETMLKEKKGTNAFGSLFDK